MKAPAIIAAPASPNILSGARGFVYSACTMRTSCELFSETEEKLLRRCALGRICRIDEHCYPHCIRVDYAYHEGRTIVGSRAPRRWHRHLSTNPKIAFEIDVYDRTEDGVFDFRGLMMKSEAHLAADHRQKDVSVELLRQRHPGAPFGESHVIVSLTPRERYGWGPWEKIHED